MGSYGSNYLLGDLECRMCPREFLVVDLFGQMLRWGLWTKLLPAESRILSTTESLDESVVTKLEIVQQNGWSVRDLDKGNVVVVVDIRFCLQSGLFKIDLIRTPGTVLHAGNCFE